MSERSPGFSTSDCDGDFFHPLKQFTSTLRAGPVREIVYYISKMHTIPGQYGVYPGGTFEYPQLVHYAVSPYTAFIGFGTRWVTSSLNIGTFTFSATIW